MNSLLRREEPAAFSCRLKNAGRSVVVESRWYIAKSLSPISGYQTDHAKGTVQALRGNLYVSKYSGVQYVCQLLFKTDGVLRSSNATSPKSLQPRALVHGVSSNAKHFYSGQNIHLICRTPSFTKPSWTWTNGDKINSDDSHRLDDGIGNLKIFGANGNDSRIYRCCGKIPNEAPLPGACVNYPVNVIGKQSV